MTRRAISASTFIYERMLTWYPPELSAEFGTEMVEVFADSLEAAWKAEAWGGVAKAWVTVLRDVVYIIVPYRGARALPTVLAIMFSVAVYGAALVTIAPNSHCMK